jgi:hypothetical protein
MSVSRGESQWSGKQQHSDELLPPSFSLSRGIGLGIFLLNRGIGLIFLFAAARLVDPYFFSYSWLFLALVSKS